MWQMLAALWVGKQEYEDCKWSAEDLNTTSYAKIETVESPTHMRS